MIAYYHVITSGFVIKIPVKLALVFGSISTASRNAFCVGIGVVHIKIDNSSLETV
jgi:hypothetical protein